ncbi:MAG: peptidyl-prolyl cis-trans isomerase [Myxococcales bacterium]|nr:peptidyl-prolyl cis-trans isomerase [Myxococcales bacterium]
MRPWLVALLAFACNPPPPPPVVPGTIENPGPIVGTVDGTPIGANELAQVFKSMRVPPDMIEGLENTPRGRHIAQEYAVATVLYAKALEMKLEDDPEVRMQMAFAQRQVLAQAARGKMTRDAVTDEAIRAWYDENKARFDKPEVRARQIVVSSETLAKDLVERLEKGEDFAELAKAHSIDPTTKNTGGEIGWFKAHEMPQIGDQVMAAEVGARLGPLESRLGFHIVEVEEKRDATPFEDARPMAEQALLEQEREKQTEMIRQTAKIEWSQPVDEEWEKRHGIEPAAPGGLPAGHPPPEPVHP